MYHNNISFILHKPQLSENIGACARAVKNFNFSKLFLINPKPIFPNDKILATSVGAKDIIKKAKVFKTLEESLDKYDILIATSARFRNKNIKHITLVDLKKIDFSKKIGFLFGSEASGLSNNEVSYADYTLQIPSNESFKSLNLSHSLIIIAQVVSGLFSVDRKRFEKSKKIKYASKKDINNMIALCIKNLEEREFFYPHEKKPIMLENLRSIFFKLNLSQKETRILSSVFAGLTKKIKYASKKDINNMIALCIKNLEEREFFYPHEKKPIMLENLRSIFFKLNLSQKETRILSSVFAGLTKKKVD